MIAKTSRIIKNIYLILYIYYNLILCMVLINLNVIY